MNGCSPEKGVAVDHRLFLLQKRPVNDFAKKRRKLNGTTPAIRSGGSGFGGGSTEGVSPLCGDARGGTPLPGFRASSPDRVEGETPQQVKGGSSCAVCGASPHITA